MTYILQTSEHLTILFKYLDKDIFFKCIYKKILIKFKINKRKFPYDRAVFVQNRIDFYNNSWFNVKLTGISLVDTCYIRSTPRIIGKFLQTANNVN